ncbi:hypothetical protein ACRAWB_03320 [Leifsonia poae]|uniref:hypothetical protein n=1 Tax=Leifsonia poae TaxID=110933 RepID=UPI003D6973BE
MLVSIPVALFIDVCLTGWASFAWCGFGGCNYPHAGADSDVAFVTIPLLSGVFVVTFLALVLPPWISGWRRPAIAATAAFVALALAWDAVFAH